MSTFEIRRWHTLAIVDGILLFGLLALTARPATDPDLWWHLRTGQWMVENRQIPHSDPFSFTRSGAPWTAHEWLSELLLFGIWRSTGWAGLIIFSSIVTTAGFMLLFWRCAAPPHWAAAATVLGALASAPTWGVRPQMFTFVLASLWLWLLERGEEAPWLLAWLLPVFLLWLNLHAGFALGPALLIAYLLGLVWETAAGETEWRLVRPHAFKLLLTLGICLVLVPLNPNGGELYKYPLDILRSGEMRAFISEWHSPDFHQPGYLPLLLLILGVLVAFAVRPIHPRRSALIALLGTFLAALDAVRHIPIFVLLAVPVIATGFQSRPLRITFETPKPNRIKLAAIGLVMALMALFAGIEWAKLIHAQSSIEVRMYPVKAVDRLASLRDRERVFAHYDWGGYLIWKLYPSSKVFVDGRADLYGADLLRQFRAVIELRPGWRQILDSWDIKTVLVPSSSAAAEGLTLDPAWRLQYGDSGASLFVRATNTSRTPEMQTVSHPRLPFGPQNLLPKMKKSLADPT